MWAVPAQQERGREGEQSQPVGKGSASWDLTTIYPTERKSFSLEVLNPQHKDRINLWPILRIHPQRTFADVCREDT